MPGKGGQRPALGYDCTIRCDAACVLEHKAYGDALDLRTISLEDHYLHTEHIAVHGHRSLLALLLREFYCMNSFHFM